MIKCFKYLLTFLVLLSLGSCATTQSSDSAFDRGQAAFKAADYTKAFELLYPLAMDGQPDSQYAVGYMMYYGKGVVKNEQIGQAWIREAAVHGQSQAQRALDLLTQKAMFDMEGMH